MNIPSTLTITDLRRQSAKAFKKLPQEKLFLLLQNSKPKGALVDLDYLKMLQQAYEEYLDILTFDKTINQPAIPWSKHQAQTKSK